MVRGLKVVAMEQKSEGKTYTVVYRWDARLIGAIGKIDDKLNKPADASAKTDPATKPKAEDTKPKGDNKTIPDKKIIIDD